MRVKFWGVRGSIPTPGRMTEKYGGNTACVEILQGDTRVILDGGTGIRELGLSMVTQHPGESALLLSHTHWDHIQGLPFFSPLFKSRYVFRVFAPKALLGRVEAILTQQMEQEVFPVPFTALSSEIRFEELPPEGVDYGELHISAVALNHPGGSYGYRVTHGNESVVYATDNEIHADKNPEAFESTVEAVRDADLLIGDAQYDAASYQAHLGWGHSSYEQLVEVARKGGVSQLAVFHHDPMSDDVELARRERLLRKSESNVHVFFARDGMAVQVRPS